MNGSESAETRLSKVHLGEFLEKDKVGELVERAREVVVRQIVGFGKEKNRIGNRAGMVLTNVALVAVSNIYRLNPNFGLTKSEYREMANIYILGFSAGVSADKGQPPLSLIDNGIGFNEDRLQEVMKGVRKVIPEVAREKKGVIVDKQVSGEQFWMEGYLTGVLVNNMRPGIEKLGVGTVIGGFSNGTQLGINAEGIFKTAKKIGKALGFSNKDAVTHARQAYDAFVTQQTGTPKPAEKIASVDLW